MVKYSLLWRVLDECRKESDEDILALLAGFEKKLESMSKEEVQEISDGHTQALAGLSDWKIFGAAWLYSGGSRDDFMLRFCEWAIIHGLDFYQAVAQNPNAIVDLKLMKGRWYESKLASTIRKVSFERFDESWVGTSDRSLWQPVCTNLGVSIPKTAGNTTTCTTLKNLSPIQPDQWVAKFPALHRFVEKNKVCPAHDRRTPMTYEKFWLLLDDAKGCHDASSFLTFALQCLPAAQIVEFDSMLDELLEKAQPTIGALRENNPELKDLSDEEIGSILVVLGKEVYTAVTKDYELWTCLNNGYERWKGQRLRQAAKQAFFSKTGYADPIVA